MIELTEGQKRGVEIACERYQQKRPYTVIAGYAGTGKTTLIQYIIRELKIPEGQVVYIAYTGKAALVLKNKGCSNAMTAHKLLYHANYDEEKDTYTFIPRASIDNYRMIVCDEVSMLPQEMVDLLLSHHIYTLFLGDVGQLPPIDGEQTILDRPHIILDEVVRQALDNPIIKMATAVRNNYALLYGGNRQCRVICEDKVSYKLLHGADQILCGKNKTRSLLNSKIRWQLYGDKSADTPFDGDKVICLHNEWNTVSNTAEPLLNGQIGTLINPRIVKTKDYGKAVTATFKANDGSVYSDLLIDYDLLMHGESKVKKKPNKKRAKLYQFAFAYAITVHKSQGSEFPRVLVYDEWLGDYEYHKKWLYTACTRAVEQLIIVK